MINVRIARYIDRYAGIALCAGMNYFGRLTGRNTERIKLEDVSRILIVKFWGLGNLVEATPAFREIRQRFPHAKITFLTLARNRGLFDSYPRFDEIIYMKDKAFRDVIYEFFHLPIVLKRRRFDLVFDMDPIGRFCALITFMSKAPIRIGFSTKNQHREQLYTRTVRLNESLHVRRIFLDLLNRVGIMHAADTLDRIPVSGEAGAAVDGLLERHGIVAGDKLIIVNVNASEVAYERRWPIENFARLADAAASETGARIVLIGGPGEEEYVGRMEAAMVEKAVNLAGRTTIGQMVELIGRCALFISNDSGPLHVAVAMGVPTVSFFGPETPIRYGPLGPIHEVIFAGRWDCSPCLTFTNEKRVQCSGDAKCMTGIEFDKTWRIVKRRLPEWGLAPKE